MRKDFFPSEDNPDEHQKTFKTMWRATLRRAGVPYFRIFDLRFTNATRLSAGGGAGEFVMQLLRQVDAKVFEKYSQRKLQMKREALQKLDRTANESGKGSDTGPNQTGFDTVLTQLGLETGKDDGRETIKPFRIS